MWTWGKAYYNLLMKLVKMIRFIFKFLSDLKSIMFNGFINWPSGFIGTFFRKMIYSNNLRKLGVNVEIHKGAIITFPELVIIEDDCIIGEFVKIMPGNSNGIYIGKNTAIAENVYIRSANHNFHDLKIPIKNQSHSCAVLDYENEKYSIVIEEDVWVGANAIILSGAFIGKGSIIAAGAVISNKIQEFSIVVGNPGRVVGNRNK